MPLIMFVSSSFNTYINLQKKKNKFVIWDASFILWHAMKWVILENLLTIRKIESLPFFDQGKPKTKVHKATQGSVGKGNGV